MTDRSKLLALAYAVEKLTGPDREVDGEIYCALGLAPFAEGAFDAYRAPAYTASLDAAMTLVGPVSFFRLGNDGEGPDVAAYKATVTAGFANVTFHDAVAATPALALCAAALRAQAEALA